MELKINSKDTIYRLFLEVQVEQTIEVGKLGTFFHVLLMLKWKNG